MNKKSWRLFWLAGIGFGFVGILKLIEEEYATGITFVSLSGIYIYLSITNYYGKNTSNERSLSNTELENMNNELRSLIAQDKRIKAIKKYRMVTGVGLKEAKEYVDLLSKKIQTK